MSEEKKNPEQDKEKESKEININLGLGGLLKGLENIVEVVGDMSEKGEQIRERVQEFKGKGPLKDMKGVYGVSIRTGLGGEPKVESFGNIKSTPKGPVVEETREPIVDVFEEKDTIQVVVEIPGVEDEAIQLDVNGDILTLSAASDRRKYQKEILLPCEVETKPTKRSYKNGMFEAHFNKK